MSGVKYKTLALSEKGRSVTRNEGMELSKGTSQTVVQLYFTPKLCKLSEVGRFAYLASPSLDAGPKIFLYENEQIQVQ